MRYIVACVLFAALAGCAPSEDEREVFVKQFVTSVYEGTQMYRSYFRNANRRAVLLGRARMTRDFKVVGWDTTSFLCTRWGCSYKYALAFSNGAQGAVDLHTEGGKFVSASIDVGNPRK
jgi:hypothetical protein